MSDTGKTIALIKALGGGSGGGGGDAHGIPSGGTEEQILAKTNNTDYAVQWKTIRSQIGYIDSDGDDTILYLDGGLPDKGFCGYVIDYTSDNTDEYDYLWTVTDRDENESDIRYTYYFIGKTLSTPYDLKIKKFVEEYDANTGEWTPAYEQTAPKTNEVSHTWIGTAAQYAALSPNYDSHTIYYITQ